MLRKSGLAGVVAKKILIIIDLVSKNQTIRLIFISVLQLYLYAVLFWVFLRICKKIIREDIRVSQVNIIYLDRE